MFASSTELTANVTGSDHQNFNPASATGKYDYITVSSPKTMKKGHLHLGLYLTQGLNTLPYVGGENSRDTSMSYNDAISGMDLGLSYSVTDRLSLGFNLPYIVHQNIKNRTELHGEFARVGNTEARFHTKANLLDHEGYGLGLLATANLNRIEDNPYAGGEDWTAYSLELLGEVDLSMLKLAVNAGYRWRPGSKITRFNEELLVMPVKDQWLGSIAASVPIPATNASFIAEVYGSYASERVASDADRDMSALEALVAMKAELPYDLTLTTGLGREVRHAISTANHRVFLGLTWTTPVYKPKFLEAKKDKPVSKKKENLTPEVQVEEQKELSLNENMQLAPSVASSIYRKPDLVLTFNNVLFDFDSDQIRTPKASQALGKVASVLQSRRLDYVEVAGHACAIGDSSYNLDLSKRRTESIVKWLEQYHNVAPNKMLAIGYGELFPIRANTSEFGRRLNRRVEFRIYFENESRLTQK
jgi:outer membrane protein OmpA-like peptidoglycan-associated protein